MKDEDPGTMQEEKEYEVLVVMEVYRTYLVPALSHSGAEVKVLERHLEGADIPEIRLRDEWEGESGFKLLAIRETHS